MSLLWHPKMDTSARPGSLSGWCLRGVLADDQVVGVQTGGSVVLAPIEEVLDWVHHAKVTFLGEEFDHFVCDFTHHVIHYDQVSDIPGQIGCYVIQVGREVHPECVERGLVVIVYLWYVLHWWVNELESFRTKLVGEDGLPAGDWTSTCEGLPGPLVNVV